MPTSAEVPSRGWHAATALGAMAHHGFELGAGVGLVFQPRLGLNGAAALWGTLLPAWVASTRFRSRAFDAPLAFAAGMSAGAVALHYAMWPWRWRPFPYLVRAEGLRPRDLPAYNAILWAWGAAASVALAVQTRRRLLPVAAAGAVVALAFRPSARRHFAWVREQANVRPAWWNRAFREASPVVGSGVTSS
jgi:hypothetical protein